MSFNIWSWLFYSLPWQAQVAIALVIALLILWLLIRVFGWERVKPFVIPVLGVIGALGMLSRSRQQGYGDRKTEEKQADAQVTTEFDKIHKADEDLSDAELDKKNDPWLKG